MVDQVGCEISGLNPEIAFETDPLEYREGNGIPGVGVKSVDIRKNTGGEGGFLAGY